MRNLFDAFRCCLYIPHGGNIINLKIKEKLEDYTQSPVYDAGDIFVL